MCSITKQFTCALVLDAFPDPSALDADVRARLPTLEQPAPGALHLCHNQSGLRDYWAVAMLHGSPAEAPFGDAEAARVIGGTRTLQFAPGTRYSYVNQNFRILSDIVQDRTGRSFAELLRTRIFDRAGMETRPPRRRHRAPCRTAPRATRARPADGFRAAENRILWTGDAGLGASLDDMIAWERHIDATRDDPDSLYSRLSAPVQLRRRRAGGLWLRPGPRRSELGRAVTGHGGALRGWRSHRLYVPAERVSVVVLFNHLSDAHEAAMDLLAAVLGEDRPPRRRRPDAARTGSAPISSRRPACRCASRPPRRASCACATAIPRTAGRAAPTARRGSRQRAASAGAMAGFGWSGRARTRLASAPVRRRAGHRTSPAAIAAPSWMPS